jgi:hypothetical protein
LTRRASQNRMFYALFWDAILFRFYINVLMLYFEMSFLPGLVLMRLFSLVTWNHKTWQEWHLKRGHNNIHIKFIQLWHTK